MRESEGHSPAQCHTAYPSITSDRYVHATHNGQWLGAYPRASVVSSGLVAVKVRLKSHGCACILHITHSHSDRARRAYGLLCMLGDSTGLFGIQPQLLPSYLLLRAWELIDRQCVHRMQSSNVSSDESQSQPMPCLQLLARPGELHPSSIKGHRRALHYSCASRSSSSDH